MRSVVDAEGRQPDKWRRRAADAFENAALGVDLAVVVLEVSGRGGPAGAARPLAVALRVVARMVRGQE